VSDQRGPVVATAVAYTRTVGKSTKSDADGWDDRKSDQLDGRLSDGVNSNCYGTAQLVTGLRNSLDSRRAIIDCW